jgi:hypothetical protein
MAIITRSDIGASWRSWWYAPDLRRHGPAWLQWVWTAAFCFAVAALFTILAALFYGRGSGWRSWLEWYRINIGLSLSIGFSIHLLFQAAARLLGHDRIGAFGPTQRLLLFLGLPLFGVAIGWPLGAAMLGDEHFAWLPLRDPSTIAAMVLISMLWSLAFYYFFGVKARQIEAEKRAAEARLRLLQGQIEPHFLFNTLANVLALIDDDAPKAKRMLEALTEHLRASLVALRGDGATLGSELDGIRAYLALMHTRMEGRLAFTVDDAGALRDARLPALLLQPLVENAIHHGLEPKVSGGRIDVRAARDGPTLVVTIADDGLGLDPPARRRKGAGVGIANLRERLAARYGRNAALTLEDTRPGTRATLRLPLETP